MATRSGGSGDAAAVPGFVDHLFRRCAGQMVSSLTRALGFHRIDLAEEVVQEALLKALETWPYRGIPDNPQGWLFRVARNRAADVLRREQTFRRKVEPAAAGRDGEAYPLRSGTAGATDALGDDVLRMMFLCCHPALSNDAKVALTLKTVGGLGVEEIARAVLASPAAVAQTIIRAKRRLREKGAGFDMPGAEELPERLSRVLEVIYLLFNEGYGAYSGENLVRSELCAEAIRLASILAGRRATASPEVDALLALMLLQAARLPARVDAAGSLVVLADQDRSLWDDGMIHRGLRHLDRAARGGHLSEYHLQAGIAACHGVATSYEATDWGRILEQYDLLLARNPSPVIALNRAVALAMTAGPAQGLAALEAVESHPAMADYYLLPAMKGEFLLLEGDRRAAAACFARALEMPCSAPEKRLLESRRLACAT